MWLLFLAMILVAFLAFYRVRPPSPVQELYAKLKNLLQTHKENNTDEIAAEELTIMSPIKETPLPPPPPPPSTPLTFTSQDIRPELLLLEIVLPNRIIVSEASCRDNDATNSSTTTTNSNSIQLTNVVVEAKQNQNIIKENFLHSNYIDCVHIICSNGLMLTIVIQRTENVESLTPAFRFINVSIEKNALVDIGNVIIVLDGELNILHSMGNDLRWKSRTGRRMLECPLIGQQTGILAMSSATEKSTMPDVSVTANDSFYGFKDEQQKLSFHQGIIADTTPTKCIKFIKNVIFP